jgi:hypothetical protein
MNFSRLFGLILICLFSNCATTPPSPIEKQVHSPNQKTIQESTVSSKELVKNQDVLEPGKSISGLENMEGKEKQLTEVVTDHDNIDPKKDFEEETANAPVDQRGEMENDENESTPLLVTQETASSVEKLKQSIKKNSVENWQESNAGRKEMDGNISDDLDTKPDITDLVITANPPLDQKEDSVVLNTRVGNDSNNEFSLVVRNENNTSKLESYFDPQRSLQLKKINVNPGQEKESNTITIRTNKLSISPLGTGSDEEPVPVSPNKIGLKVDLDSSSDDIPISKKNVNFSLPAEFDSVDNNELNNNQKVNLDSVQLSLLNEDAVLGNSRVGFQGQKDRQEFELESTKFQVGLREQTENPILRNQTTNDRRMIEPNYSPKTYGHLRTFLDRTKKTQEPRAGGVHSQLERTQNYLNRESNTTKPGGGNRGNDLLGNRYEKTQEWIKNRGRSQSELILE